MMKIKVGGAYRTRGGERVEITEVISDDEYPFLGSNLSIYTENGTNWVDSTVDGSDLIAPWHDEEPARVDSNREWMASSPTTEVGKWIGWNGGECPVHPETVVEVTYGRETDKRLASVFDWNHDLLPIVAYRVITEYVEPPKPREFWVDLKTGQALNWCSGPNRIHVREVLGDD